MKKLNCILAFAICLTLQPAFAQTLAEKELYAKEEKNIASNVENVAKQCQASIKLKWDWASFKKEDLQERGASTFCNAALSSLSNLCQTSDDARKAVQAKVKSVTCKQATPRSITLKSGELVFGIDYNAANNEDAVMTYLKNNI